MSIQTVAWAIKQNIKPAIAKLLLVAIANYADDNGKCWPSIATLAHDCSYDRKNLKKVLRYLESGGWIAVEERIHKGGRLSNVFTLMMGVLAPPGGEGISTPRVGVLAPQGGGISTPGVGVPAPHPSKPSIEPSIEPSERLLLDKSSECAVKPEAAKPPDKPDPILAEFEDWYAAYPRHVGRGQALKAYRSARRKKVDPAALLEGARKACERYADTDQKFIPHPATWLNGERWLDEWKPPAAASTGGELSLAQMHAMLVEIDQELAAERQGMFVQ